ncbi:MAG: RIP metalloprotease RseP [Bacteroidales bacterium]|nr:RIP metalloprotease RseP [Bacteroidales bacterium]
MVALIKTLQVILALSLLILVHEMGHFCFAKLFGIRVEKFFLFFDLGGGRLFSTKKTRWFTRLFPAAKDWETEYGIGWLPLGGYCKIAGMIDESLDLEQMSGPPQPWEFRAHNPFQRLLVMAGGVLFNFVLAFLAFVAVERIWGESYVANRGAQVYVSELAYDMGFRNGDEILRLDDYEPDNFGMLQADLARRDVRKVRVLRGGDSLDLYIDQARISEVLRTPLLFDLAVPFVVDSVLSDGSNAGGALRRGDRITALDSAGVRFLQDARPVLLAHAGRQMTATVQRGADTLRVGVQVDSSGRLGVMMAPVPVQTQRYKGLKALGAGWSLTGRTLGGYLRDLRLLATPSTGAYKSVGSFIAIGQAFPASWDWYQFVFLLALFSIMLAVMNLLPIPGLDGGHILFTLYEIVSGRKPSDRFMAAAQMVGMVLLLALMFLAFGNDIGRLIH